MKYICYWSLAEINMHTLWCNVLIVGQFAVLNFPSIMQALQSALQMWIVTNIQKYALLLHILLQTCQESIYYF